MFAERLRQAHEQASMVGWDFGRLEDRLDADEPPWDFETLCLDAMADAERVVDLGTGGGERVLALLERLAGRHTPEIVATEGWPPNLPVARAALAPRGIDVVAYDADADPQMPFADDSVDLVMSRHESYAAAEVARVLRPGGRFLTQQVAGDDAHELRAWFGGAEQFPHVRLDRFVAEARAAGLDVVGAGEWTGTMRFQDARTLVEYLAMVPWDVEDFRVDDHLDTLRGLDDARPIEATQRRFWLDARRPR